MRRRRSGGVLVGDGGEGAGGKGTDLWLREFSDSGRAAAFQCGERHGGWERTAGAGAMV